MIKSYQVAARFPDLDLQMEAVEVKGSSLPIGAARGLQRLLRNPRIQGKHIKVVDLTVTYQGRMVTFYQVDRKQPDPNFIGKLVWAPAPGIPLQTTEIAAQRLADQLMVKAEQDGLEIRDYRVRPKRVAQ